MSRWNARWIAKHSDGIQGKDVLLECLSNLTANEMYREDKEAVSGTPEQRILDGILKIRREAANFVVVTNEVFSDGETYSEETKEYMERLGKVKPGHRSACRRGRGGGLRDPGLFKACRKEK